MSHTLRCPGIFGRPSRHIGVATVALALVISASGLFLSAPPASATVPGWGSLAPLTGAGVSGPTETSQAASVSCGANGDCAVGGTLTTSSGSHAWLATITGGSVSASAFVSVPDSAAYTTFSTTSTVTNLSCPAAGACVAVGTFVTQLSGMPTAETVAWSATSTNHVWSPATIIPSSPSALGMSASDETLTPVDLSCAAVGACVLVGTYLDGGVSSVFTSTQSGVTWHDAAATVTSTLGSLTVAGVSCPSPGWCALGANLTTSSGATSPVVDVLDSGVWTPADTSSYSSLSTVTSDAPSLTALSNISCAAPNECAVAGQFALSTKKVAVYVAGLTATGDTTVMSSPTALVGLANLQGGPASRVSGLVCPDNGDCTLAGIYDRSANQTEVFTANEVNGTWGSASLLPGSFSLNLGFDASVANLSCITDQVCALGGGVTDGLGDHHTLVATETPSGWSGVGFLPDATGLNAGDDDEVTALACSIAGSCVAAGTYTTTTPAAATHVFVDEAFTSPPPPNPPREPVNVTALPGSLQALVSWQPPVSTGGSMITTYKVTASPGGSSCTTSSMTCIVPNLTDGTSYTFVVTASNISGPGNPSLPSNAVTPSPLPSVPLDVTLAVNANTIIVSWQPPVSSGSPVLSYTAVATPGGKQCTAEATASPLSCRLVGLTNGTHYGVTVSAQSAIGVGPSSSAAYAVPEPLLAAPTNVRASATGIGQVTVRWLAPAPDGALPLRDYVVTSTPPGYGCTVSTLTCVVKPIPNGKTLTFTVTPVNASGAGAASLPSAPVTTPAVASPPTNITVLVSSKALGVSWSAPVNNGGEKVTEYIATGASKTQTATCATVAPTTGCQLTNLTNGNTYTITVVAINVVGSSRPSAPVSANPATPPSLPRNITIKQSGNNSLTVHWRGATSDGGSPITSYVATASPGSASCTVTPPAANTCVFSDFPDTVAYSFSVVAINAAGTSLAAVSAVSVEPTGVPSTPAGLLVAVGRQTATITWDASTGGDTTVSGYTVTATEGGTSSFCQVAGGPLTCTFNALTDGETYSFSVVATNAYGNSAASTPVTAVPGLAPSAPSHVGAAAETRSITVSWHAPLQSGDPAITSYVAKATFGGHTYTCGVNGTTYSCAIYGLTSGDTYIVTVTATNVIGVSPPSVPLRVKVK